MSGAPTPQWSNHYALWRHHHRILAAWHLDLAAWEDGDQPSPSPQDRLDRIEQIAGVRIAPDLLEWADIDGDLVDLFDAISEAITPDE